MVGKPVTGDGENSAAFYRMRQEQELTLAAKASSNAIREIHLQMAETYRQLIEDREFSERQEPRTTAEESERP